MNDFTKEELERICQFFNIAIEDYREPDSTYYLRDKIQSLIENYCEHDYNEKSVELHAKQCCKCQKVKVL